MILFNIEKIVMILINTEKSFFLYNSNQNWEIRVFFFFLFADLSKNSEENDNQRQSPGSGNYKLIFIVKLLATELSNGFILTIKWFYLNYQMVLS